VRKATDDLLRRYIREAIDLGDTQFSPERTDGVDTSEPNTPEEQELYNKLLGRAQGSGALDAKLTKTLRDLINSEKYGPDGSGFFGGPDNTSQLLYRGHAYTQRWVDKHVADPAAIPVWDTEKTYGSGLAALVRGFGDPIPLNPPYTFGPNPGEGARGWTPDFEVAMNFARSYGSQLEGDISFKARWKDDIIHKSSPLRKPHDTEDWTKGGEPEVEGNAAYSVVLVLDPSRQPPDALLDFSRNIYKLKKTRGLAYEKEVMNITPVQCNAAYIVRVFVRRPGDPETL